MPTRKSTRTSRRSATAKKKKTTRRKTTSRSRTASKKVSRKKTATRRARTTSRKKATTRKKATSRKKATTRKKAASRKKATSRKKTTSRVKRPAKTKTSRVRATKGKRGRVRNSSPAQVLDNARIPTLALEDHSPRAIHSSGVSDQTNGSTKFGFVGSGQCGGRLAESFYQLGYHKVLAVNTANHDLDDLRLPQDQKLLMDIGPQGAGKDMSRGRDAALQYREEITESIEHIFHDDVDHVMLTFGSGGGTGSGSATPLLETLRSYARDGGFKNPNRQVGALCTLPSAGEACSPRVADNAARVISELTRLAKAGQISPLIIVDNEKIGRMYPNLTVSDFWPTINNTVTGLFDIFNRLSALSTPYTAFDAVDYQSIIQCGGCCIMGLTKLENDRFDLFDAMRSNVNRTLLANGFRLETAKYVGAIVVGGRSIFRSIPGLQDKINNAFDVLADITGDATVHRGILEDDKPSLRVYTIFGGLNPPEDRLSKLERAA